MDDPLGYFLTWTTYGTWLPGDERGWFEYRGGWRIPDVMRELDSAGRMTERECVLDEAARKLVESQIVETCLKRGWALHAVNCRSNHVHVVVTACAEHADKVLSDLKAWTTRRLKTSVDSARQKWWTERGSTHVLFTEQALADAIVYVRDGQDRNKQRVR